MPLPPGTPVATPPADGAEGAAMTVLKYRDAADNWQAIGPDTFDVQYQFPASATTNIPWNNSGVVWAPTPLTGDGQGVFQVNGSWVQALKPCFAIVTAQANAQLTSSATVPGNITAGIAMRRAGDNPPVGVPIGDTKQLSAPGRTDSLLCRPFVLAVGDSISVGFTQQINYGQTLAGVIMLTGLILPAGTT